MSEKNLFEVFAWSKLKPTKTSPARYQKDHCATQSTRQPFQKLPSNLSQFLDTANRTPIEFNTAANTVDAGSKNHHVLTRKFHVVFGAVVRQVQVVGDRWPLGGHRVDLLHERMDT